MRKHISESSAGVALAVLLGVVGACAEAGPLDVQTTGADGAFTVAAAGGVQATRPLAQRSSGLLIPAGPCATGIAFTADGAGVGRHVGRFDIDLTFCLDSATGGISSVGATVVAADGARISMMGGGQAISQSELLFHMDIVGGTGRFAGASGMLDVTALLDATGGWTSEGTGWIAY